VIGKQRASALASLRENSIAPGEHSPRIQNGQRQQQSQKGNQEAQEGKAEGTPSDSPGFLIFPGRSVELLSHDAM
jgi:hypothetical protein